MAKRNEHIPAIQRAADKMPLRFSFKHLDFDNPKFDPAKCSVEYFLRLFGILQRFSSWFVEDFIDQNNHEHRHIIPFEGSTEKDGFQHIPEIDREQLGYHDGWQFGVCPEDGGNRWRVHGILVDDTFYVVWLDQYHQLFP